MVVIFEWRGNGIYYPEEYGDSLKIVQAIKTTIEGELTRKQKDFPDRYVGIVKGKPSRGDKFGSLTISEVISFTN